jgi:hypothetical protein
MCVEPSLDLVTYRPSIFTMDLRLVNLSSVLNWIKIKIYINKTKRSRFEADSIQMKCCSLDIGGEVTHSPNDCFAEEVTQPGV